MAEKPEDPKPKAKSRKKPAAKSAAPKAAKSKANEAQARQAAEGASVAPLDRMVDAAMALAAERSWRELSLREIAEASGLPLAEAYRCCPSKRAILRAFLRRIDAAVLAEGPVSETEGGARDRLFDVIMRRFDALQPYRKALGSILLDEARDPLSGLAGLMALQRSLGWMLETAGLEAGGLRGTLRLKGLTAIYLATLRTWLRDDSLDLSRTMAALDGYLRRVEAVLERLPRRSRAASEAAD